MTVHEIGRSGPAEHGKGDDAPIQDVVRATMLVTRSGCATLTRADGHTRRVVADPARVVFLSPGDRYRVHYPAEATFRATVVTFADAPGAPARDAVAASADLLLRVHGCRNALLGSTPVDARMSEVATTSRSLASLVEASDATTASKPAHRDLAERACAMLAAAPGDAHHLPDVARALGVSPFFLARIFRAHIGVSLHQYLLRLRLGIALEHVVSGERNLSALAVSLGFATHSHFTATFRRAFGASPRVVRATLSYGARATTTAPLTG